MVYNVHRNHRLIRNRENGGKGVWRCGKGDIVYLSLHCHHQNDTCIKVGSDQSRFNVSLIVWVKVTRQVSTDHNFSRERRAEADSNHGPSPYQPNALPLGQTGSRARILLTRSVSSSLTVSKLHRCLLTCQLWRPDYLQQQQTNKHI